MSLRVWLPLNGSLENKGLDDIIPVLTGAVAMDNEGKIGKCYKFGTSLGRITIPPTIMRNYTECSVTFWVNILGWQSNWDTFFQAGLGTAPWNSYIFGVLRNSGNSVVFTISDASSSSQGNYKSSDLTLNTWYHLGFTYKSGHCCIYVNGNLYKDYSTNIIPNFSGINYISLGQLGNASSYQTNCKMNDFRIYDHALSPLEVKHIAQGLILHYPLNDNSIQTLDNCFTNPRFDTGSGWNHWGRAGHQGSSGQSNDANYCFRSGQSYVHWVSNAANATGEYLLYQSPSFTSSGGGIRSLQCICKEENSIKITDDVCFPVWNARNGGVPNEYWTSIESLGNGFYLCKCEGISQDGSNNLVGIYIKPGYKVYFSEVYLENYKSVCSDIFFPSTVIYDTSGYGNNGTLIGSFNVDKNTPKYNVSTVFNGVDNCIQIGNWYSLFQNPFTINVWFKKDEIGSKGYETLLGGGSGFEIDTRAGNSQTLSLYLASARGTAYSPFNFTQWYMVTMVSDGTNELYYVDGILRKTIEKKGIPNNMYRIGAWSSDTSQNFKGQMSDFRIYATALSADDVKSLYNNSAYIDNQGNIYGAIYEEV